MIISLDSSSSSLILSLALPKVIFDASVFKSIYPSADSFHLDKLNVVFKRFLLIFNVLFFIFRVMSFLLKYSV